MEIEYRSTLDGLEPEAIKGFFVGWANPPSPTGLVEMLEGSSHYWLAFAGTHLVGYVRAITDGFYSAFIPELEVVPEYQGLGIGNRLMANLLGDLAGFYSIDTACDDELIGYYERFGFTAGRGMLIRRYENQAGR